MVAHAILFAPQLKNSEYAIQGAGKYGKFEW